MTQKTINAVTGGVIRDDLNDNFTELYKARLPAWLQDALTAGKLGIGYSGQSNSASLGAITGMVTNDKIKDYRANSTGAPPQAGPFSFQTADPNYASGYVTTGSTTLFTGMTGTFGEQVGTGASVNVAWYMADLISKRYPDLEIYLCGVHMSATGIAEWLDGGDAEVALSSAMAAFTTETGLASPHIFVWDQGEQDRYFLGRTPTEYETDALAMKANFESDWAAKDMLWLVMENSESLGYWSGQHRFVQGIGDYGRLVSSKNIPTSDSFHFTGEGQVSRAKLAYAAAMQGPLPTNAPVFDIGQMDWSYPALSDVTNGASAVAYQLDTDNDLSNALALHTSWRVNGTEIAKLYSSTGNFEVSGTITCDSYWSDLFGFTVFQLPVIMSGLATSDPGSPGVLWNDGGTVKISL